MSFSLPSAIRYRAHPLFFPQRQPVQVGVEKAVDGVLAVALLELVVVLHRAVRANSSHVGGTGRQIRSVDATTLETLQAYSSPGNIRELQNVIERWAIGCDAEELSVDEATDPAGSSEFFEPGVEPSAGTSSFRKHVEALERKLIQRTIIAAGGNQSEAARRLGLNRGSFLKLLKKYRSVAG
jgi:DNA-binding NtrC family response regulator